MKVTIANIYDCVRTDWYDIDEEDYTNWLKENNINKEDDSLLNYINDMGIESYDYHDEYDLVEKIINYD